MAENETAPVKEAETQAPAKKTAKSTKPTNVKKIILIVVGIIVGIIILIIAIAMLATSGPRKISDSFINNIQTKNASAGYAELSTSAQTNVTQQEFKDVVEQIGPVLSGKPSNESSESETKNGKTSGKVVYTIKGSDGNTYKITITLVKQTDGWKVELFDSKKQ